MLSPLRSPPPDIGATVEARIREERAAEVTVEPKAQAIAKAMVEATATPVASPESIVQVPTVPAINTQTPTPEAKPTTVLTLTPMLTAPVTSVPTNSPIPTSTPVPTFTATPTYTSEPTVTPTPSLTPMLAAPVTPIPTNSPIPTSTPLPTFTATPTYISEPTVTPASLPNIFDEFGFTLALDQDTSFSSSKLTISGMRTGAADGQQGLLTFEYNGADIAIFWLPTTDDPPAAVIESTYQLLRDSQPANILIPVSDGDISIDDEPGKFGGFVATNSSGENAGGGLIASWACQELGITLSLVVTGPDATVLQIRFDRLVSGFICE